MKNYVKLSLLLLVIFITEIGFGDNLYGLIMTPLILPDNMVSGGKYSNQGTFDSLTYEDSAGGIYSNSMVMDLLSPDMICSHTLIPGDYDGNDFVDLTDFSLFAIHWLEVDCLPCNAWCGGADINSNRNVNIEDIVLFAFFWL